MKPTVVAYYSRTGKTRYCAERLADLLDADLEEILEARSRKGLGGWITAAMDAYKKRSAKLTSSHNAQQRQLVVIGGPVWAGEIPSAVRTYMQANELAGKKVAVFVTYRGGGEKTALASAASLCPQPPVAQKAFLRVKPGDLKTVAELEEWATQLREVTE